LTYSRCNLWTSPFALWSDVIQKAPNKPRGYFWRGELLLNQGKCREAAADLTRFSSLKKSPELNSQVYLGLAYSCSGDGAATVRAAEVGIAALGENPKLYWIKARGYALQSRFEDALAAINRAIGLDANSTGYLTTRGSILLAMGRRADAQADLERALQISPSDVDALRLMNQLRGMR
jgi:tetratricopeptide (TPR) repeat protein